MSRLEHTLEVAVLAMLLSLPGALPAQEMEDHGKEHYGVEDVAWLGGCWEMSVSGFTTEEHWMSPRGGVMLGLNRTIRSGRGPGYEFLILRESGSDLVLEARPSGQTPTVFTATRVTANSITLENPQHDFPKRIRYVLRGPDSLAARVDGGEGERGFDQLFRRVGCD